jgi:hypothetical protein
MYFSFVALSYTVPGPSFGCNIRPQALGLVLIILSIHGKKTNIHINKLCSNLQNLYYNSLSGNETIFEHKVKV